MSFILSAVGSRNGSMLISAILGLGLATVFRTVCDNCIVVRAVHPDDAVSTVWVTDDGDTCVRYGVEPTECVPGTVRCINSARPPPGGG
jgi:hypothetical protein